MHPGESTMSAMPTPPFQRFLIAVLPVVVARAVSGKPRDHAEHSRPGTRALQSPASRRRTGFSARSGPLSTP